MKKAKLLVVTIVAGVLAAPVYSAIAQASDRDGPPPPPPWVNENGTVDIDKMPDEIPLLDANGEVCGYIDRDELYREPTAEEMRQAREEQRDLAREVVTAEDGTRTEIVEAPPVGPHC